MAYLPQPPFDFEKEELVTGSLDIGTERLAGGFGWLVTCVQEQNQLLSTLCGRVDGLQAGGAVPSSQTLQTSMKEEMLSMQLNTLRHEVSSLPRSGDLERQRERIMAEVSGVSNSVSDRQRDSDERMQKELANVTDALCKQLERISSDVSSRLTALEERVNGATPSGTRGASESRGVTPPTSVTGSGPSGVQDGAAMAPAVPTEPIPISPFHAAEDTEDHTDGALEPSSAAIPPPPGASLADISSLDARLGARMEALERQLAELSAQQQTVQQQVAQQVADTAAHTAAAATATAAAPAAEVESAAVAATAAAAQPADSAAATAAAVQAATEAVAATRAADQEAINTLRDALSQMSVQLAEMKAEHAKDVTAIMNQAGAPSPAEPGSSAGLPAAAEAGAIADGAAGLKEDLAAVQGRLEALEASLKMVEATLPEFKKAVPNLEASIRKVEEALASVAESRAASRADGGGDGTAVFGSSGDVSFGVDAGVLGLEPAKSAQEAAVTEQTAAAAASPPEAGSSNDLAMLRARLLALEEWQEQAEKRLKQAPEGEGAEGFDQAGAGPGPGPGAGPARSRAGSSSAGPARSRAGSSSKESRHGTSRVSPGETKTSEFYDGHEGPPGGRWKDVQAELENFRKLFEFIEGVLPEDAAEAMRFFNRRQQGKEELSGKVSEVFGPDVDFVNAKSKLENEFKTRTLEMHREFENLALALKGLQRDVESSGGKIQDLGKRMSQVEGEARDTRSLTPLTNSMEEQPHQEPSPRLSGDKEMSMKGNVQAAAEGGQVSEDMVRKSMEELREDVRQWLDMLRASVLQALQTKPDHDQVSQFVKEVVGGKPNTDTLALFAKRSLIGKCASCEAPIDVDIMRVKRPQPISLQGPWPVHGDNLGAKVAIRPMGSGSPPTASSVSSHGRLPKINDLRPAANFSKGKAMKPSSSSSDVRREPASSTE